MKEPLGQTEGRENGEAQMSEDGGSVPIRGMRGIMNKYVVTSSMSAALPL